MPAQKAGGLYKTWHSTGASAAKMIHRPFFSPIDRLLGGMLSWGCPGRGAEAKSSRADIPRSFGGPSERCSKLFRRSCPRQFRRGGWGDWL